MRKTLLLLGALVVLSLGQAQTPGIDVAMEPDGYLTMYSNNTPHWNRNRAGCTDEQYGLGAVFTSLKFGLLSRAETSVWVAAEADPEVRGIRYYHYFRQTAYDNVGNTSVVLPVGLMVEISMENLSVLNPNFAEEALPSISRSGPCFSQPVGALETPVAIFLNNGGRIVYSTEFMSVPLAGVEGFSGQRLLDF